MRKWLNKLTTNANSEALSKSVFIQFIVKYLTYFKETFQQLP